MNLQVWEPTIQMALDAFLSAPNEPGKQRVLKEWRSKLEKEPHKLQAFQIDEIVREVRRRSLMPMRKVVAQAS
jgi:hypothetical protein